MTNVDSSKSHGVCLKYTVHPENDPEPEWVAVDLSKRELYDRFGNTIPFQLLPSRAQHSLSAVCPESKGWERASGPGFEPPVGARGADLVSSGDIDIAGWNSAMGGTDSDGSSPRPLPVSPPAESQSFTAHPPGGPVVTIERQTLSPVYSPPASPPAGEPAGAPAAVSVPAAEASPDQPKPLDATPGAVHIAADKENASPNSPHAPAKPEGVSFTPGARVRVIKAGPLQGSVGRVSKYLPRKNRWGVELSPCGKRVAVQAEDLAPITDTKQDSAPATPTPAGLASTPASSASSVIYDDSEVDEKGNLKGFVVSDASDVSELSDTEQDLSRRWGKSPQTQQSAAALSSPQGWRGRTRSSCRKLPPTRTPLRRVLRPVASPKFDSASPSSQSSGSPCASGPPVVSPTDASKLKAGSCCCSDEEEDDNNFRVPMSSRRRRGARQRRANIILSSDDESSDGDQTPARQDKTRKYPVAAATPAPRRIKPARPVFSTPGPRRAPPVRGQRLRGGGIVAATPARTPARPVLALDEACPDSPVERPAGGLGGLRRLMEELSLEGGRRSGSPQSDDENRENSAPSNVVKRSSKKPTKKSLATGIAFSRRREELTKHWFQVFNERVFGYRLPGDLPLEWCKRLNTTAGVTYFSKDRITFKHKARIKLAAKILDTEEKLKQTLCHEMCHAATWIVSKVAKPPHGREFQSWGKRAQNAGLGITVTTCHRYKINYKFRYQCINPECGYVFGRHSDSINVTKKACGACGGGLKKLGRFGRDGTPIKPRKMNRFAQFVKLHFRDIKRNNPGTPHKDLMKIVSVRYKSEQKS